MHKKLKYCQVSLIPQRFNKHIPSMPSTVRFSDVKISCSSYFFQSLYSWNIVCKIKYRNMPVFLCTGSCSAADYAGQLRTAGESAPEGPAGAGRSGAG